MVHRFCKIIIACIVLSLVQGFSAAQSSSCTTCWSTAKALQEYLDMTTAIMSAIQTQGWEVSDLGAYTVPWLFGWGVLSLEQEQRDAITRWLDATARNINQKIQATLATTTILFTNVWDITRDNAMWLGILVQNQVIVRDRSKLQRIGSVMQDKIYELSLWAARQDYITPTDLVQINSIIAQYKTQWLIDAFVVESTATYANLLFVLQKTNRARETFIIYNTTEQLKRTINGEDSSVYIKFKDTTIDTVSTQYACARFGDQCASNLKQFVTDIKSIGTENIQAAKSAGKDVVDAGKKLAWALQVFGKQTANFFRKKDKKKAFTDAEAAALSRQDQLLRTVYGSDFKRMQWWVLASVRANVDTTAYEAIKDAIQKTTTQVKKNNAIIQTTDMSSLKEVRSQEKDIQAIGAALDAVQLPDGLKKVLTETMVTVHASAVDHISLATAVQPHDVVVYVPLLAEQLDRLRDLVGTKDTKGMIVHNLGTACELQCSNAGWTCWW